MVKEVIGVGRESSWRLKFVCGGRIGLGIRECVRWVCDENRYLCWVKRDIRITLK